MTLQPATSRLRLPILVGIHLFATATVAAAFAWQFGHNLRAVAAHVLVVGEWDLALLLSLIAGVAAFRPGTHLRALRIWRLLLVLGGTLQFSLYSLHAVSNLSWNRNMTAHLVAAFAPTVWSGKEPFPIGPVGITAFALAALASMAAVVTWKGGAFDAILDAWLAEADARPPSPFSRVWPIGAACGMAAFLAVTTMWGVHDDGLFWKHELVASFLRPGGFAFEPTARRHRVAERDAVLSAAYPHLITPAHRKHVILIIVDSLRADRMQVYGYGRPTTPFLSEQVQAGRMKKVDAAFSTCSESFCGITSVLAGREFRDISARTFQLQDVLRDAGYQTWFLLSGNHGAWNGLPQFYRATGAAFFDGSQTTRYTMDDDRLVLEGLERVPPAADDRPAFFYLHLMSTHYLGVQFPESHVFTHPDDTVHPGLEPYKMLERLNKPDRYDDKVRQADATIRQIFDALSAKGYLDDAVVVVTADHGEGLGERHWAHGWHLYNEDIRIPLLIYDVPAARYPDLSFGVQADIAPTILDRLGLPIPESWQGQSLLRASRSRFTYHQTYFLPNRFAVIDRDGAALFKFIATPQYGKEELYDLVRDRGETHNLVAEQPGLAALLREKVRAYLTDEP